MSVIRVMNENLANKIAAGEVIEKCASVVKELVENSIDAKSKNIKINLGNGGLSLIEVIDDGMGMEYDDALTCFQRHATSKIYKDDDLFFIDTLGFRGEALPSIASVSEVNLETCKSEVGTHIHIKGGEIIEKENAAARIGTIIKVENLFYNTPARLKYLKSEQTELSNSISYIEKLSLAKPEIAFTLTNNGNTFVKTSGSGDLLKTIHEIFGLEISKNCLKIHALSDDFEIDGYICKPSILKSSKSHMITFVNGRVVKNNDINKAINDAYYTYKPDIKFPIAIINIYTDPTLIDVNIHPTKQDIKISKMNDLYNLLYETIKDTLYHNLLIPDAIKEEVSVNKGFLNLENDLNNFSNDIYQDELKEEVELKENKTQLVMDFKEENNEENVKNATFKKLDLYPVGLCLGTYIVCENEEGVYLIDQHAAQERVNYEKYLDNLINEKISIIDLLIPINIELSSSEYNKLKEFDYILKDIGIIYEDFGVNTIIIKSHPTWLREGYEEEQVRKIIDLIINLEKNFDIVKFRENVAITLSCKMAIKANEHISMTEIEGLINNLLKCDQPYNCPHGRPTIIKFSIYDLEKMFKRAMN